MLTIIIIIHDDSFILNVLHPTKRLPQKHLRPDKELE
jgi:hypothetical protein